ncbi:uncharacterized protein RJT21DRAFT_115114 [Scheffersomyces amazonensis]|uniref:uncharacterized protein n=1 Tax=Scheffersomyces amazonensis TaxID=1078765 RepID=UPI00315DB233
MSSLAPTNIVLESLFLEETYSNVSSNQVGLNFDITPTIIIQLNTFTYKETKDDALWPEVDAPTFHYNGPFYTKSSTFVFDNITKLKAGGVSTIIFEVLLGSSDNGTSMIEFLDKMKSLKNHGFRFCLHLYKNFPLGKPVDFQLPLEDLKKFEWYEIRLVTDYFKPEESYDYDLMIDNMPIISLTSAWVNPNSLHSFHVGEKIRLVVKEIKYLKFPKLENHSFESCDLLSQHYWGEFLNNHGDTIKKLRLRAFNSKKYDYKLLKSLTHIEYVAYTHLDYELKYFSKRLESIKLLGTLTGLGSIYMEDGHKWSGSMPKKNIQIAVEDESFAKEILREHWLHVHGVLNMEQFVTFLAFKPNYLYNRLYTSYGPYGLYLNQLPFFNRVLKDLDEDEDEARAFRSYHLFLHYMHLDFS